MTPHMEALAYRIWAYANPREWDCSYAEIADGTGVTVNQIHNVIVQKGWGGRGPGKYGTQLDTTTSIATKHRKGYDIDPNLLAVDQLML